MTLDDMLNRSAPATSDRSPALTSALTAVTHEAEKLGRRVPRSAGRRLAMTAALSAGALGLTAVAAAATGMTPTWLPWSTSQGSQCEMQFFVSPRDGDGEPAVAEYTPAEERRAATLATRFLSTLDYSSIDDAQAIRDWQRGESAAIASAAPGEAQPRLRGDDLEITAVGRAVWSRVAQHLIGEGFTRPQDAVSFGQGWRCR